jgi:hypothetical protein
MQLLLSVPENFSSANIHGDKIILVLIFKNKEITVCSILPIKYKDEIL